MPEAYGRIDAAMVQAAARRWLDPTQRSVVTLGPGGRPDVTAAKQRTVRAVDVGRGLRLHRFQTPGGLPVTVAQRGRIPLVAVRLVLASGAAGDPAGKEGLADFTMRLLRRGTAHRDAHALDEAIEFVGASLGLFAGEDQVAIALTTPAEHLPAMLEVLSELVRVPSFPEEEVRTERERSLGQFANDVDDPSLLADRALLRTAWAGHPYGHDVSGTRASVSRFGSEDPVSFHAAHFGPRPGAPLRGRGGGPGRRRTPDPDRLRRPGRAARTTGWTFPHLPGSAAQAAWWWSTGRSRPRARSASPVRRTAGARRCSSPPRW